MERIYDAMNSFRCCMDMDIESFLREKAIEFLKRKWCSVYLVLNEQAFDSGKIKIEAYFTLSHKTLIPDNLSKSKIRAASGFKDAESIHFVLIGHLGKHMERKNDGTCLKSNISGNELLDFVFDVIRASDALIPCRCALVECNESEKVQKVYLDYQFTFFQRDGDHFQLYRQI